MTREQTRSVTLAQLIDEAKRLLGSDADAMVDIRSLVTQLAGLDRARQLMEPERQLPSALAERLRSAFERRAAGEPVAYITGFKPFWRHEFQVTPATLIPRPETEHLLAWALEKIPSEQAVTVADLGTGSGVLAISLAFERPQAQVFGCDLSFNALQVARENERQLQPDSALPIEWIQGSWCGMFRQESLDVIVCNPPYIRPDDPHLKVGDLRFEPQTALVSEDEGMADYRQIIDQASTRLKAGGWLLFEHGYDQAKAVAECLTQHGFASISHRIDLAGQMRNTAAQKV
ncbi:MAG: protein-(glutamine-N5) methyltransferase, release factor-specific [Halothiobacillus sp. 14-55-98]|nr:MAG: protein-(glutamine-N5) methyltransferase, release factor-specific [Halothiobacillus sp. 14-55-98]